MNLSMNCSTRSLGHSVNGIFQLLQGHQPYCFFLFILGKAIRSQCEKSQIGGNETNKSQKIQVNDLLFNKTLSCYIKILVMWWRNYYGDVTKWLLVKFSHTAVSKVLCW